MTAAESYGDELAVVTVTYSPGEVLDTFLDTLVDATKRTPRIVLADNGSVDGAPERAAASPFSHVLASAIGMGKCVPLGAVRPCRASSCVMACR